MVKTKPSLWGLITIVGMTLALVPISFAIVNGYPDENRHPYVGYVQFINPGGDTNWCSGVLIAPTVVITAAHCVYWSGEIAAVRVTFDPELTNNNNWVAGTHWATHPEFCIGCAPGWARLDTHDIAVIVLAEPVVNKGFAALPQVDLTKNLPNHTPVTMVGYGAVRLSSNKIEFGRLRNYATALLIQNEGVLTAEFIKLTENPGNSRGGICAGDSGGPALLDNTNIVLATTTLFSGQNCSGVQWSYRLDTQSAQDFIKSFLP